MKALAFFLAIALVFVVYEHYSVKSTPTTGETLVKLYYYNPVLDQGPGGIECSEKGLVGLDRHVPDDSNKIVSTIKLLISGDLTFDDKTRGIETEFPLDGLTLKSSNLYNGVLTLEFDDPYQKTSGGSCRVSVLRAEIEKTALQFPEVTKVILKPDDAFQP